MSNGNNMSDLRSALFDTLRGLKDGTIKPETAKSINDTAQTIINSAKVEVDFIKETGKMGAVQGFLGCQLGHETATGVKTVTHDDKTGITSTVHKMRG